MYISRLDDLIIENFSFSGTLRNALKMIKGNDADIVKAGGLILRALIDFKIEENKENFEPYIVDAVSLAGRLFNKNIENAGADLFKKELDDNLLNYKITQKTDLVTQEACMSRYSIKTSRIIEDAIEGDILFIGIAHGGLIPSVDIYQRVLSYGNKQNSILYPIRFSKYKKMDKRPVLSNSEKKFFSEIAVGRSVVILDEDTYTQNTLENARSFFSYMLNKKVAVYANLNRYEDYMNENQLTGE